MYIYTPVFLTNVAAERPPGKVEDHPSQTAMPARHPPTTPAIIPYEVARAHKMDSAIGTTLEAIKIPVKEYVHVKFRFTAQQKRHKGMLKKVQITMHQFL